MLHGDPGWCQVHPDGSVVPLWGWFTWLCGRCLTRESTGSDVWRPGWWVFHVVLWGMFDLFLWQAAI